MAIGVGRLIGAVGRGLTMGGGSKAVLGGVTVGAMGLGMANSIAPAARDAALEFAMGDPNADVAFTGRKVDTRFLAGTAMGGPLGFLSRASAPSDYLTFTGANSSGEQTGVNSVVGGLVLGGAGYAKARSFGKGRLATAALTGAAGALGVGLGGAGGMASRIPNAQQAIAGGTIGGVLGAATFGSAARAFGRGKLMTAAAIGAGGLTGAYIGAGSSLITTRRLMAENEKFYSESPYRQRSSMSTLANTNAVGDIVLGMHNSRRGY